MTTEPPFTEVMWAETKPLRAAIDDLEFLHRLGDGTLPIEAFYFYMEQDALYLAGYGKALALLAARSPDRVTGAFWAQASATCATVEMSLHEGVLAGRTAAEPSPTCLGYVSYLIAAAATAPYPVAAAAVLPCFWIYGEVGRDLAARAADVVAADPAHPYAQWVTTYDSPQFQADVLAARKLVAAAAAAATESERAAMLEAFRISTRYELLFWDTALHPQPWPQA